MSRHSRHRSPRAHWVLLTLMLLVLAAELMLNGYVRNVAGESGPRTPDRSRAAPAEVTGGGPVLRVAPDGAVTSRAMPATTVALTFDDGPDPVWTPKVLDVLARHDAHGTFFVIGSRVNEHPALVRRMVTEGHEVGVHTFTHVELSTVPAWRRRLELTLSQNAIAGAAGVQTQLLRPPYASTPDAVTGIDFDAMRDAAAAGYLVVLTDKDTEDWGSASVDTMVKSALPDKGAGAVVMFHDGGGDRSRTVAALDQLLTQLTAQKYKFLTVSEALGVRPAPAPTGGVQFRGEALRAAQVSSSWLATAMTILLGLALALGIIRLVAQVPAAALHARHGRVRRRQRRLYLGPVSVIVPAYNESANIANTVRSLIDNDYPRFEVIVVDDGSTDNTAGIVARLGLPGVRVIRQPNAGKPAALNTGIAASRGDLLVLVDGDTVLAPDAIGQLVQRFAEDDVGAVSGNTKVANRRGLLGRWQHLEYVVGLNLDRRMFELGECMPTVPGAIGAFRREALADVGGVSASTMAEDTDLTMAVIRAGWRVVYEDAAIAWTEAPSTVCQLWRQRYRWSYGTMQAMWKHRRSIMESGPAGRLGRRGLAYLLLFQVLLPFVGPAVDVFAAYGLMFLPVWQVAGVWLGFVGLQAITAAYALRLDRERLRPLWALPLQQLFYRQLMYLIVVQSAVTAVTGMRLRWHRVARTGQATLPAHVR